MPAGVSAGVKVNRGWRSEVTGDLRRPPLSPLFPPSGGKTKRRKGGVALADGGFHQLRHFDSSHSVEGPIRSLGGRRPSRPRPGSEVKGQKSSGLSCGKPAAEDVGWTHRSAEIHSHGSRGLWERKLKPAEEVPIILGKLVGLFDPEL